MPPFYPKWVQKRTHILRPLFIRTLGGKTDVSVCVRLFVSIAQEVCGAPDVPQVREAVL